MSTVYVLEPPKKGKAKVVVHGPLDIELWPKEAPKSVRNFGLLCLEGYYDKTILHRVMEDSLVQGGHPTATGTGLVTMANAGTPQSNGSQFFITLDRCDWLDKKHTIFETKIELAFIWRRSCSKEAEEEEKELTSVKRKIKSSHDVLNDPRLLKEETSYNELSSSGGKSTRDTRLSVRNAFS